MYAVLPSSVIMMFWNEESVLSVFSFSYGFFFGLR